MITKISPIEELKQIFIEEILNHQDKVTKISNESTLNAIAFGIGKVGQKAMKEIALVESQILPESAFGSGLDNVATRLGISPRYSELGSSCYIRLVGDVGTTYSASQNIFQSTSGITFKLTSNITIGVHGFIYALVRSVETGLKSNADPLTINSLTPIPVGHKYVINEFKAIGGRDLESDELFLRRIQEGPNILAQKTLSYIEQVFNKIDSNILNVYFQGSDSSGKNILSIVTQNGATLTNLELQSLLEKAKGYFSLTDYKPYNENYNTITLQNMDWTNVDLSTRLILDPSFNPDDVRKSIQIRISKYLDFRTWGADDKVEWDKLLLIVSTTKGVKYVADQFFSPRIDILVGKNTLPRLRGFLMLDLDGNILSNIAGTLNPIYYPTNPDFSFQSTVLSDL